MYSTPQHKIILIHHGKVYISWTGEVFDVKSPKLLDLILHGTELYIAGEHLHPIIAKLDRELVGTISGWKVKYLTRRRRSHRLMTKEGVPAVSGQMFPSYVAIDKYKTNHSRENKRERLPRKLFEIMNLELFATPVPEHPLDQMDMANAILDMCDSRGVKFRATRGSLASSFLKKSPKWEKSRRSALPFINQHARKYLPGNFYSVSNRIKRQYIKGEEPDLLNIIPHVYTVDQSSAHHNIGLQIKLPHPESIRARGYWKTALRGKPKFWCHPYSFIGEQIVKGELVGLHLAQIRVAHTGPTVKHLLPPFAQKAGGYLVWIWTPDIRIINLTPQILIESFYCSMSGTQDDEVLKEYAEWALAEIERDKEKAKYKKPTLLSAWGMLGFDIIEKPILRYYSGTDKKNATKVYIPVAGVVDEIRINMPKGIEPSVVNVVNRGLIEAETRTRTLEYAIELHRLGYHVAQVYADSLNVATDSLPFIKEGWRISDSLTNVWIPESRTNAYLSDTTCKLPGVMEGTEEDRVWRERYEDAKKPFQAV